MLARLKEQLADTGGWLSFCDYMQTVLYHPEQGYYTGEQAIWGAAGDFVTAPEITPLFAETLADPIAEWLAASSANLLEFGAGSGRLAVDLMQALARRQAVPERYLIVEISRRRIDEQRQTIARHLPDYADRFCWLDDVPPSFCGVMLANEVADAMPVHLVHWRDDGVFERGVVWDSTHNRLAFADRPAEGEVAAAANEIDQARHSLFGDALPRPYLSEIGLHAQAWLTTTASQLERGTILLIDYGFPRHTYYHPDRTSGTLMCHRRHMSHSDPLFAPGEDDLTAHVDFTALAMAAHRAGLDLLCYATQAAFLLQYGLLDHLARVQATSPNAYRATQAVQRLTSPAEMGELFKVLVCGRGMTASPTLSRIDQRVRL